MKTTSKMSILACAGAAAIFGCAAALPPQDLVNARTAYDRASKGPAQELDPTGMHVAKQQLDAAEASFANDGDTQETRDGAYLAIRKTQLAEAVARTMQADRAKEGVVNAMHADEKKAVASTAAELGRTKAELATQGVALKTQGAALEDEKARRQEAEKRAAA